MANLIFGGIQTALTALRAQQHAQLVADHNVANANTPGYTRQEVVLGTRNPYAAVSYNRESGGAIQMGQGAQVELTRRMAYDFYDDRLRTEVSVEKQWLERADVLRHMEAMLPEKDGSGVAERLSEFWGSWQQLSTDSADPAVRRSVRDAGVRLAQSINERADGLVNFQRYQDARLGRLVEEVNQAAARLAKLNERIVVAFKADNQPNDLLDERDRLRSQLSELTGSTSYVQNDGSVVVSIGRHVLVARQNAQLLQAVNPQAAAAPAAPVANPAAGGGAAVAGPAGTVSGHLRQLRWEDGQAAEVKMGTIGGLLIGRDKEVVARLSALERLSNTLRSEVNALHKTGFGLPPANATGQDFFVGNGAAQLAVHPLLEANVGGVAAAAVSAAPGDGSVALKISQLESRLLMDAEGARVAAGTEALGATRTILESWADAVAALGADTVRAQRELDSHSAIVEQLTTQRDSVTGVSLDEEAARVMRSQRAYQAAARVLTNFDQMAEEVVMRLGMVGR
ncbi:MAG: flagellar hook-associated protein FlgK [Chloroflexi bacterium]|nr:MAG: flagellar hook-associated protein FlgK [Chloroflexota bacterium]